MPKCEGDVKGKRFALRESERIGTNASKAVSNEKMVVDLLAGFRGV
jgi:hypothetical protein